MKKLIAVLLTVFLAMSIAGCGANDPIPTQTPTETPTEAPETTSETTEQPEATPAVSQSGEPAGAVSEKTLMNIGALKGPSAIGLAALIDKDEKDEAVNDYTFTIAGAPDELVGKITSGEVDAAAVPFNLAATLYNKTNGGIKIASVNTLSVLYILENGDTIKSIDDLRGKTVYATGKGSTPEFALNFILEQNGIKAGEDVTIEYLAEHAELAALMASGDRVLGMLPEPNVTSVLMNNSDVRIALDLNTEWEKAAGKAGFNDSRLTMTAFVVNADYLAANKAAVDAMLDEYKDSVDFVNGNVKEAAVLVAKYGIMPKAEIAEKAIPNCNIIFISGKDMIDSAKYLYQVLFESEPKSIGGKLPDESFYYEK